MRIIAIVILVSTLLLVFWWMRYGKRRHRISLMKGRKELYRKLDHQARGGDEKAMYRIAQLFYKEKDEKYFPTIYKWVQILAALEKDPAVWMELGDLLFFGYGTDKDLKRALSSYEQALSFDIAAPNNAKLSLEAHNYVEQQIILLRKQVGSSDN